MRNRLIGLAFIALLLASMPSGAYAATAAASAEASVAYDLDFSLPTTGKSGCLVCHGDSNLVRLGAGSASSIFVDIAALRLSAHRDVACSACHVDFAYSTPHETGKAAGEEWRDVAKSACKNCHQAEFSEYSESAHSPARQPGKTVQQVADERAARGVPIRVPLCGDCHGGHSIMASTSVDAQKAFESSGLKMCGSCHTDYADGYRDYYHGAAYRAGAPDAPSCWDCHTGHSALPTSDRQSAVSEIELIDTCGKEGCHVGVEEDETFLDYADIVHGKGKAEDEVIIFGVWRSVKDTVSSFFSALFSG